jgi:hypothetical protein
LLCFIAVFFGLGPHPNILPIPTSAPYSSIHTKKTRERKRAFQVCKGIILKDFTLNVLDFLAGPHSLAAGIAGLQPEILKSMKLFN